MRRRDFIRRGLATAAVSGLVSARAAGQESAHEREPAAPRARFFHLEERDHEWFVVSPGGRPFFLRGANHYGDGSCMPWNLTKRYGSVERWRREVRDRHRAWGFNYLPPSIGPSETKPKAGATSGLIRRTPEWAAADFAEMDFPFTAFLEVPRQYMAGRELPDVFSKGFRELVDRRCREFVAPLRDNPHLIGYHFTHNPPWHPTVPSFNHWIQDIVKPGTPAQAAWTRLMRRIYGTVDRWRETYGLPITSFADLERSRTPLRAYVSAKAGLRDRTAFMGQICEEWYKVFSETIRKYDPNHLILGDRNTLHLHPQPEWAIYRMRPYVDVLCVNAMGPIEVIYELMEQITPHWDGPVHLADTGAGVYSGDRIKSGYTAADREEFEHVYRGLMQSGLDHPQVIGMGWCGYYENSTRSGLVHAANDEPLAERVEIVTKWNRWIEQQFADRYRELAGG